MVMFSENMLFSVINIFFTNIYFKYSIKFPLCGEEKVSEFPIQFISSHLEKHRHSRGIYIPFIQFPVCL